jgi:hypothetical protein
VVADDDTTDRTNERHPQMLGVDRSIDRSIDFLSCMDRLGGKKSIVRFTFDSIESNKHPLHTHSSNPRRSWANGRRRAKVSLSRQEEDSVWLAVKGLRE